MAANPHLLAFHTGPVSADDGQLVVARERVADLNVPTGELVVVDALIGGALPLADRCPIGTFPFVISTTVIPGEDEPRPVAATLEVAQGPVVRCVPARRMKRGWWFHRSIRQHQVAIDSWHLGIFDIAADKAREKWLGDCPPERDLLMEEHQTNAGLWNDHRFPGTPANMVTCFSGMGSGAYPVYWGLDAQGERACLIIDFEIA